MMSNGFKIPTPRENTLKKGCPVCNDWWTAIAVPREGVATNARVRCMSCLAYWEVKTSGEIVNLKGADGKSIILLPKMES